jgi:translation initiation factor IF-3
VIDAEGKQVGVLTVREALAMAAEAGLDLVEISPNATPPVCKIMDYGKFRYEKNKKAQEAKKKQTIIQVKEIKLRPRTDVHDLEVKKKHIRQFIAEGNKVKLTVRFRGREMIYKHFGIELIDKVTTDLSDITIVEGQPSLEGQSLQVILSPKKS